MAKTKRITKASYNKASKVVKAYAVQEGKKGIKKGAKATVKAGKSAIKGAGNWMKHLSKVRKTNPSLSLRQAMIKAKKTYKK